MTQSTKIKDFQIGDKFSFYGAIFEVTGEVKSWTNHTGPNDTELTYGRDCKFISMKDDSTAADALLKDYDRMQGTESVKYAKIIN